MKKEMKGFFVWAIILCIMFSIPSLAINTDKSISALIKTVAVNINGKQVNGEKLEYNGNIYIRADKVAENLGNTFTWNKTKNNIAINRKQERNPFTLAEGFSDLDGYNAVFYKLGDTGLYELNMHDSKFRQGTTFLKNNQYYFDKGVIINILELLSSNYEILPSKNPYIKGTLYIGYKVEYVPVLRSNIAKFNAITNYSIATETEYTGIRSSNTTYEIVSIIDNKRYPFSYKPGEEKGCIKVNDIDYAMNVNEIVEYFGYNNRLKIDCDDELNAIIIQILS